MTETVSAKTPFRFDLDLSQNAMTVQERLVALEAERVALEAKHSTELAAVRKTSEAKGRESAEAIAAKKVADDVARIAKSAASLLGARDKLNHKLEHEACELAYTIGTHLAETALAKTPFAEIEALLKDTMDVLSDTPHLVLYLPLETADDIKPQLTRLLDESGFTGRLIIKSERDFNSSDVRLEWSEGQLVRDLEAAKAVLREKINHYFEAI
ncbi:MAG: hypothetical protein V7703_13195 [Hyphomicrobiales bacterium]